MNRLVYLLDFKSSPKAESLLSLVENCLKRIKEPDSRINIQNWVVYCNDRRADNWNIKIKPKSKIVIAARFAPRVDLQIAYESNKIVVFDKPAGLPTQKTLKKNEENLFDQARLFYIQQKNFPSGIPYVGLHHRLDRGTSGLVLMTKQRQVNRDVANLFKNHKISKKYIAFAEYGEGLVSDRWTETNNIRRGSSKNNKFVFEVADVGDQAVTDFEVIERKPGQYYKIYCRPRTGRTHQLRVQLSHKGFPILGDSTYGKKQSAARLMLQAFQLKFILSNEEITVNVKRELSESDL